ncbi:RES domain-containing protein [Sphingomonas sp. PB2P19]|uniref:RES family NAD+ phosphorylase n=1 Tax=Sphingomonas rhamnosi TaxID=3096156 RepID=UPI002FC8C8CC
MTYPLRPLAAPLWRMIYPRHQLAPFSGDGARLYGGRWNMRGTAALYLALDYATAVAEYYQGLPKPGMLAPYRVEATRIADLTRPDERVTQALACDWKAIALIAGQVPPSSALTQELIAAGAQGAIVPSVQNRGGQSLVLWRWHDAPEAGDGAALTLLDPEAVLRPR